MNPRTPAAPRSRRALAFAGACSLAAAALAPAAQAQLAIVNPTVALRPVSRPLHLNGTSNLFDAANAVTTDSARNVIAAGFKTNAGTDLRGNAIHQRDFVVAKFSTRQTLLWERALPGGAFHDGEANAVAVDRQNNVIAAGWTTRTGPTGAVAGTSFTVAKWDADGTLLWQTRLGGTYLGGTGDDKALDVKVDSRGDVIAAGSMINASANAEGTVVADEDFTVVKLSGATGAQQWRFTRRGTDFGGTDRATAVAVDLQDNIVAAGFMRNFGSNRDIALVKISPTGAAVFGPVLAGFSFGADEATSVAVDGQNHVAVAGFVTNRTQVGGSNVNDRDFWVARYAPNGVLLWQDSLKGSQAAGNDTARSVGVDGNGNIVSAGELTNMGTGQDFAVMKWTPLGQRNWAAPVLRNGSASDQDQALAVAVHPDGTIAAGGYITATGQGRDFMILKLNAAGAALWNFVTNGSANGNDVCRAVALDSTGWASGAGVVARTGNGGDFTVAF